MSEIQLAGSMHASQACGPQGFRTGLIASALALILSLGACGQTPNSASTLPSNAIILLKEGSFEAGGQVIGDTGRTTSCDHGHVEYQIPIHYRATSLFLWHSSSAAVWQRRWDGGDGFQSIFLRRGWPIYIWDGPRVGRANYACVDYQYKVPTGADQSSFRAWRFGPSAGQWFPGVQFPTGDAAAVDQAMRARYDEFDTVANAKLEAKAAAKAIDSIGPTVLVTNSAGGIRAMLAALESDRVAAIVAYENPDFVYPDDVVDKRPAGKYGPVYVSAAEFAKLTRIPIQLVWGDNVAASPTWAPIAQRSEEWAAMVNARGGNVEVLHLPDKGLHGNTHIAFADMNNVAVANLLSEFLARHGLDHRPHDTAAIPEEKP